MFITFEGLDGVGKTTQAERLVSWLQEQGYDAVYTREPGGTSLGRKLRQILLESREDSLTPAAEVLLMAADRAQHVQEVIRPALLNNKIVVCDRYVDSSLAYQGYGLRFPLEQVRNVNQVAVGGTWPDLTLLLDVDIDVLTQRLIGAERYHDKIEERGREFQNRVRRGYLELAAMESGRFYRIDAGVRGVEDIQAEIRRIVEERMGATGV